MPLLYPRRVAAHAARGEGDGRAGDRLDLEGRTALVTGGSRGMLREDRTPVPR